MFCATTPRPNSRPPPSLSPQSVKHNQKIQGKIQKLQTKKNSSRGFFNSVINPFTANQPKIVRNYHINKKMGNLKAQLHTPA